MGVKWVLNPMTGLLDAIGKYEPIIAAGTSAQYWRGDKSWQTLNQAAVAGLTTTDSPTFAAAKLTNLTDGYVPYHASDALGLADSGMFWDNANTRLGIGTASPIQQLELTESIRIPVTISAITGVIYKGTEAFLHNFQHPTGGGAVPNGRNVFVGLGAGNFTMGATATLATHSSQNVGLGVLALGNNTLGSSNMAIGYTSLRWNTTGANNMAIGSAACYSNTTGNHNIGIGTNAVYANTTGTGNIGIGSTSFRYLTSGNFNVTIGADSSFNMTVTNQNTSIGYAGLFGITTGDYNTAIGSQAGRYYGSGTDANQTSSYGIFIGVLSRAKEAGTTNETVIGYNAVGEGSNTIRLGNSSVTDVITAGVIKSGGYKASDGSTGWTGTFTNGDGDTVTVTDGLITGVA